MTPKVISIRTATIKDMQKVYEWLFYSDISSDLNDLSGLTDNTIPSFKDFFGEDMPEYFFTGAYPYKGRTFIIELQNQSRSKEIGTVHYTAFHLVDNIVEFDIWMKSSIYCGKGYGTAAIRLLEGEIRNMGFEKIIMRPHMDNKRAVSAYKKAGFIETELIPAQYYKPEYIEKYAQGDYGPNKDVFMVKPCK